MVDDYDSSRSCGKTTVQQMVDADNFAIEQRYHHLIWLFKNGRVHVNLQDQLLSFGGVIKEQALSV